MLGGSSKTDDFVISGEESVLLAADFVKGKMTKFRRILMKCSCGQKSQWPVRISEYTGLVPAEFRVCRKCGGQNQISSRVIEFEA